MTPSGALTPCTGQNCLGNAAQGTPTLADDAVLFRLMTRRGDGQLQQTRGRKEPTVVRTHQRHGGPMDIGGGEVYRVKGAKLRWTNVRRRGGDGLSEDERVHTR